MTNVRQSTSPFASALRLPIALSLAGLLGCAGAPKPKPADLTSAQSDFSKLENEHREQSRRITELETRIALLEQEARRDKASYRPTETVRIGGGAASSASLEDHEQPALQPVTVVRLHEEPRARLESEPIMLPPPPPGVSTRLPVVPLPAERLGGADELPSRDPTAQYREALGLLKERRFAAAIEQLSAFTRSHPDHALVAPALYWQGEAHYAERRYLEALHAFQGVADRYPKSDKAADALLKAGLCHMRLGQRAEAVRYFDQVRERFPHSEAAQSVPREGST